MNRNLIITGIPRSGSTLACSLLNRLPDVVALNETMNVGELLALPDAESRVRAIADYFAETRRTIDRAGKVPQLQVAGSDGNMFLSETSTGRQSAKRGSALGHPPFCRFACRLNRSYRPARNVHPIFGFLCVTSCSSSFPHSFSSPSLSPSD